MSSNLLRSLIRNPWNSDCSESVSNSSESVKSLGCLIREMAQDNSDASSINNCAKNFKDNDSDTKSNTIILDRESDSKFDDLKFQRWYPPNKAEEKIVRFSQEMKPIKGEEKGRSALQLRPELEYNPENFATPRDSIIKDDTTSSTTTLTENEDPKNNFETFKDPQDTPCRCKRVEKSDLEKGAVRACSRDCPFSCCNAEKEPTCFPEIETTVEEPEKLQRELLNNLHSDDSLGDKNIESVLKDSTYDEIVTIINVLEQEETNSCTFNLYFLY